MLDVFRVEKKYYTNPVEMEKLKERLDLYMKRDIHNGKNGYCVRSLYFDSLGDRDYYAKEDGIDDRKKIRLRIYDSNDNVAKLELKEKSNGLQRKRSLSLSREEAIKLIQGDYSFLNQIDSTLAKTMYCYMTKEVYVPKCIVEYDRYAFICEENNIRITFDQKLRGTESTFNIFEPNIVFYPIANSSEITLEVKYDGFLLGNIKNALSYHSGISCSNSKYCRARKVL